MWVSGTDPEFFIKDETGKPVPAWRFFPDKHHKMPAEYEVNYGLNKAVYKSCATYGSLHRDGYAVEINTKAEWCRGNVAGYFLFALDTALRKLPEGYTIVSTPAIKIDLENDLKDAPPDCQVFGCDPAWNAYTREQTTVGLDAATHEWRYAGGHLHISNSYSSGPLADKADTALFIKMCDRYIGLPLTVWFKSPEMFLRRQHYGKAGEFRFQKYGTIKGVEYRTPGPEVWNTPAVYTWASGTMRALAENFTRYKTNWDEGMEEDIVNAINTGEGADELVDKSGVPEFCASDILLKVVKEKKPFQSLALSFVPGTGMGHVGWEYYTKDYNFNEQRYLSAISKKVYGW